MLGNVTKGGEKCLPMLNTSWQITYTATITADASVSNRVTYKTPTTMKRTASTRKAHIWIFLRLKLFIILIAIAPPRTAPMHVATSVCHPF